MSFYDPSLAREYNPMYRITAESPWSPSRSASFGFRKKDQEWQYDGEQFSLWGDPAINPYWVKKIQEVDPELVPLWVKVAFKSPSGGVEVFTRHGLARCLRNPHRWDEPMKQMLLPTSPLPWKIPGRPNIIVSIFRDPGEANLVPGLPIKPYVTFTKNVYDEVKYATESQRAAEIAEQDVQQWKTKEADKDKQRFEKIGEEADYRFDTDNRSSDFYSKLRDMPASELEQVTLRSH